MRIINQYPEFKLWHDEGLIIVSTRNGRKYYKGEKLRTIRKLQSICFDRSSKANAGASKSDNHTVPVMQLSAESRDRARQAFRFVNGDMIRNIMWDMVISLEISSARARAAAAGYRWPAFVDEFDRALCAIIDNAKL